MDVRMEKGKCVVKTKAESGEYDYELDVNLKAKV